MSTTLATENAALRAQLSAVGEELRAARLRLQAMETARMGLSGEDALRYRRREALFLVPRLIELLPPGDRLVIVDAGAREADADPRWKPFPPGRLRFFGFEPDASEASRLNERVTEDGLERRYYSAGLWRTSCTLPFEHNKSSGGSSFLPQNRMVTDRWKFENSTDISLARDVFFPVCTEAMRVICLDDWAAEIGVQEVDFLKLNVQGGELEILKGASTVLATTLGLLVEVSFVESYCGRPMFADIDTFLRQSDFTFFDLLGHHYVGRAASPIGAQHLTLVEPRLGQGVSSWGQLVEGHALYLRDPVAAGATALDVRRCLKLAALAEAYGQIEFAIEVLDCLLKRGEMDGTELEFRLKQVLDATLADYQRHHILHAQR